MSAKKLSKSVYYLGTGLLAICFVIPLIWALIASVSPQAGTSQTVGYGFGNYVKLFTYGAGLPAYLTNSVIISVVCVVVTLVVATSGGYAFARYRFPFKNTLFVLVLSVMMVPYAALLIPLIVWLKDLGLSNSLVGVGLVLALFQLPFSIFMMRNAFSALPQELEDAALIDGCGPLAAFLRVMLPSVVPSLVTIGLFSYLAAWNDFMVSLYLLNMDHSPLPLALVNMRQQTIGVIDYGLTTAGVVVLTLPAFVLFLALQRYYIRGITSGAVKG
ncbi:carbohydrate ABC transporter permease [Actinomyces succiniciruminis]|uniref:ABC-type transporter, integral membrane subunit n=1 Tax=Actinomyces succiniciruminis TaxID=1522002 RepID=A0A1L7RJL4_9ACTO|nr:carbohydrate ABC transporter permease [Actinomyces succiniciruminis]CED90160.1 ABC-type transporter, integral membrane subunit [Actinomyces succiniciruminis]